MVKFLEVYGVKKIYLGDVNGDGFDDIIIGALKTTNFFSGAVYVVYGNATLPSVITISTLGSRGFTLEGANWAWCGYSVSGAGEIIFQSSYLYQF